MTASTGILRISPIASKAVTWPTETCGSRKVASDDGDHDVGVGDEVQPPAGAHPVDGGDDRLPTPVVPGRSSAVRPAWSGGTARAGPRDRRASWTTSRPVWKARPAAGVDDDPDLGVGVQLCQAASRSSSMSAFMALPASGRLKISQPTGPCRSITRARLGGDGHAPPLARTRTPSVAHHPVESATLPGMGCSAGQLAAPQGTCT